MVERTDPLISQLEHFCRVIRGEESPLIDGRDAAKSLSVVLAVLESIERQAGAGGGAGVIGLNP